MLSRHRCAVQCRYHGCTHNVAHVTVQCVDGASPQQVACFVKSLCLDAIMEALRLSTAHIFDNSCTVCYPTSPVHGTGDIPELTSPTHRKHYLARFLDLHCLTPHQGLLYCTAAHDLNKKPVFVFSGVLGELAVPFLSDCVRLSGCSPELRLGTDSFCDSLMLVPMSGSWY